MKFAFIGQDVPRLLPTLLADLLFAGRQECLIAIEEKNAAMQDLLERYSHAVAEASGVANVEIIISRDRNAVLDKADCVFYAGDCMAASRFKQDYEALRGPEDDPENPGLTNQCRPNGGIEGLMHTLRQGEMVYTLCEQMQKKCPHALVMTMAQPTARVITMFERCGFRCFGFAGDVVNAPSGLKSICDYMKLERKETEAVIAGLPDFTWLLSLKKQDGTDMLRALETLCSEGALGRLARRWLDSYGAIPVGDVTAHAQLLPEQEDYIPEADPEMGESVEKRKERILRMNTVVEKGLSKGTLSEGEMAQWMLLSEAPAARPMQLALALLRGESLKMMQVCRLNKGAIRGLPTNAVVSAPLTLEKGEIVPEGLTLPMDLSGICWDVDETARLAAAAAQGDASALRECIELDPAMEGLDRLYCQQAVRALIAMNDDVICRLMDEEEEDF